MDLTIYKTMYRTLSQNTTVKQVDLAHANNQQIAHIFIYGILVVIFILPAGTECINCLKFHFLLSKSEESKTIFG